MKPIILALLCAGMLAGCGTEQEQKSFAGEVAAIAASEIMAKLADDAASMVAAVAASEVMVSSASAPSAPVQSQADTPPAAMGYQGGSSGMNALAAGAIGYMLGKSHSQPDSAPAPVSGFNSRHQQQYAPPPPAPVVAAQAEKSLPKPVKREMRPAHERKAEKAEFAQDKVPVPAPVQAPAVKQATAKGIDVKLSGDSAANTSKYRVVEKAPPIVPVPPKKRDVVPQPAQAVKPPQVSVKQSESPKPSVPQVSLGQRESKSTYTPPPKTESRSSSYSGSSYSSPKSSGYSSSYSSSSRSSSSSSYSSPSRSSSSSSYSSSRSSSYSSSRSGSRR